MNQLKKKALFFLVSQGVTLFGSSIVQFAIVWYVTLKTASGVWVSVLTVAAYVPQFIISFFAGTWADRYPRKRLIILADATISAATLGLAISLPFIKEDTLLLLSLVIISVIRSIGTGIQTPAVNATIPQLVPEDKLMKYNGINATIQSLVQFVAPAVAGAVLSVGTFRMALMIDIITAIVGIGILSAVTIPFVKSEGNPPILDDIKVGFSYAVKEKSIGQILLVFGVFIFLCVPTGFLATLFVSRYYGDTYWYLTIVEVVSCIGMTAGGILIGTWGGFKSRIKTLIVGIIAFGVLSIGMGIVDHFIIYLVLMAVYGVALTMVQTASTTLLQENADPQMTGRVFGLFGAMYSGFLPIGMVLFGPLADMMSLRILMVITGVLLIVLAMTVLRNRRL